MGRGFTQYAFPDSDKEDAYALYSAFLNYRLPDGSLLHVRQTQCWCPTCDRIDMAEDIPSLTEFEAELDRLLNPDEEELKMITFIGTPIAERIEDTTKRIEWRRNRKSPAKCLHCGSTEITAIPHTDEFAHPKTGERVKVVGSGFASTAQWHAVFTTEGDVLSSVEK